MTVDIANQFVNRWEIWNAQCTLWVISGKAHFEHLMSALPPYADIRADMLEVCSVPIDDIELASFIA